MKPSKAETRALKKYLVNYAEPESTYLDELPGNYQQGLVIPFYKESTKSLQRFCDFAQYNTGTLLILVINRPDSDSDKQWIEELFNHPPLATPANWQSTEHAMGCWVLNNNSAVLIVDRGWQGPPINSEQGVGLARKIGADILTRLIHRQQVKSPWIACTDADAILPDDYFNVSQSITRQPNQQNTAACIYPFAHIFIDDTPSLPTLLYEYSLHYYVNGLRWAGSPYAYHTIGSILCPHYLHYAQVRGFPKRAAAEDFYLLNKLAKTGLIKTLQQPVIELVARESSRVPFGTGPAVIKLAEQDTPLTMPLYHPHSFTYLQFFLQLITQMASLDKQTTAININDQAITLKQATNSSINIDHILSLAEHFKLPAALTHSFSHGNTAAIRQRQLQHWFDGFKTLKFIHWLRDNHLPTIEYSCWRDQQHQFSLKANPVMIELATKIQAAT